MTTKTRNIIFMSDGTSRTRSTRGSLAVVVCGLLVAMSAPSARACVIAGDCDGFGVGVFPPTWQRPVFAAALAANAGTYCDSGFPRPFGKENDTDCFFGHTFAGLSDFCCPADLRIHLKAGSGDSTTDQLRLGFVAPFGTLGPPGPFNRDFAWNISLGALDGMPLCSATTLVNCCTHAPGFPNAAGGGWNSGEDMECVLDLCNLPPDADGTTNLNSAIRTQGALDVFVEDDTGVDCLSSCHNSCSTKSPAVSEWGLGALALLLLSGVALKFGRRRAARQT